MGKRFMAFIKAFFYYIAQSIIQKGFVLLYILVYLFFTVWYPANASHLPAEALASDAFEQLSQNMTNHTELALLLANTAVLLVIILAFRLKKRNILAELRIRKTNGKNLAAACAVGLIWSYVLTFFLSLLYDLTAALGAPADYTVVTVASVIIIGPIMEEIVYRGIIFNQLNTRMKAASSAIISAFLFALGHNSSFAHWLLSFLWGITMVWLYRTTGTLVVPILAHMTNNAVAELVSHHRMPPLVVSCVLTVILIGTFVYIKHINRSAPGSSGGHSEPPDPPSGL